MRHRHICSIFLSFLFIVASISLNAYQPIETMFDGPQAVVAVPHHLSSNLISVNGAPAFQQQILNSAKPVIVLVDHPDRQRGQKQRLVCERLAHLWREHCSFASIDLTANARLVATLMGQLGLNRAQLPMLLFFNRGKMQLPIMAGYTDAVSLAHRVQQTFFPVATQST